MSILVEAVSVVVPRHVLDASYPGGCDAYLEGARRARGVRFVVADERLTSVSLATLDEATAFVRPLQAIGLTAPDGASLPMACVDEHFGPTAPAPWLRWRRHEEGYTSCWLEWTEPGPMARPDVRQDYGPLPDVHAPEAGEIEEVEEVDEPPVATATLEPLELSEAFRLPESFELPEVLPVHEALGIPEPFETPDPPHHDIDPEVAPHPAATDHDPDPATPEESTVTIALDAPAPDHHAPAPAASLLDALREGLDRQGWRHGVDAAQGAVFYQVPGSHATYGGSAFADPDGVARVLTHLPVRIPAHRRAAVVELLTRVNHSLPVGNFDFDYATGEVRFRATTGCGAHVPPDVVDRLLRLGVSACDRVHEPLMQVVYGGVEAEMVVG